MAISVLEREMYSEAEAARLLRLPPSTLNYWLEGGRRGGKIYQPIIREQPRGGHPPVTWSEFIEASWMRQYRRIDNVPMAELRVFITRLRERYGVPYPLAHFRAFANQGQLVLMQEAQTTAGLDPDFCLVAEVSGQLVLTPPADAYVRRIEWDEEHDAPMAWRPHDDPDSPVRIYPDIRFGRPSVGGISTDVLWEQVDDGADPNEVANDYGVTIRDVQWAVSYETAAHARVA
ncbi:MAG TPA: hypothetical protein VH333_15810 [Pseudonocardiaceae bacterium]|nr:hypothetical protein [Pseudonocardiaceae bacterium]